MSNTPMYDSTKTFFENLEKDIDEQIEYINKEITDLTNKASKMTSDELEKAKKTLNKKIEKIVEKMKKKFSKQTDNNATKKQKLEALKSVIDGLTGTNPGDLSAVIRFCTSLITALKDISTTLVGMISDITLTSTYTATATITMTTKITNLSDLTSKISSIK